MNLLVLMYHRARAGADGNAPGRLDAHFAYVARRHHCVLPGEPLVRGRLNVCLTFDDAFCDFYHVVFPLLRKHSLRALLAVSPGFVVDKPALSLAQRLSLDTRTAHQRPVLGGICTWGELRELTASGNVSIAAHGLSHVRLDDATVDLEEEILAPRTLLQARLHAPVDSFVFPYGRFSGPALALVRQHYRHAFRIGGATNYSWRPPVLYRVAADNLPTPIAPFTTGRLALGHARHWWNRLRLR